MYDNVSLNNFIIPLCLFFGLFGIVHNILELMDIDDKIGDIIVNNKILILR